MTRLPGLLLCLLATAALADGDEPITLRAGELPLAVRAVHASCAEANDIVNLATDRIGKSVLLFVTCRKEAAAPWPGELRLRFDPKVLAETPVAVYLSRDRKVRRLTFPVLLPDGAPATIATLPANAEADGESKGPRSPWVVTLWKPDRPGMCKIRARWKIVSGKAELWRWEEAPTCTNDGPQYRTILDRHPPRLSRE